MGRERRKPRLSKEQILLRLGVIGLGLSLLAYGFVNHFNSTTGVSATMDGVDKYELSATAYFDSNYNDVFDAGDEPVYDIPVVFGHYLNDTKQASVNRTDHNGNVSKTVMLTEGTQPEINVDHLFAGPTLDIENMRLICVLDVKTQTQVLLDLTRVEKLLRFGRCPDPNVVIG